MRILNPPDHPRITTLVEMVRTLSTAETPLDVYAALARGMWPLNPVERMVSFSTADLPAGQYRVTRNIHVASVLAGTTPFAVPKSWPARQSIPVHTGGFLGWVMEQRRPLLLHDLDLGDDPALGACLSGLGSAIAIPLYDGGEPKYWTIQFQLARDGFSQAQLENMLVTSNLIGGTNTRLLLMNEVTRLNAALTHQFEEVARVQQALLPRHLPDIPGLEIATSYLTSDQAGGDYYDFFPLEDGRWGVLIADVSGHGAAAATIMAMLHGILHAYTGSGRTPDAVMSYANHRLFEAGLEGNFVTAFFAVYDPKAATFSFARSGHNPPLLKHGSTGTMTHLDGEGALPLGLFEPYEVTSQTIRLKHHDTVILYTDGITEAFNGDREMFGPERLDAALTKCSGAPDCVVDSVHAALFEHTGARTRADDQTLVALRYSGG